MLTRINHLQLFEQLKNLIIRRRALRLTKGASIPPLTDLDFFLLGAVTKLFATSVTYPCASLFGFLVRTRSSQHPDFFFVSSACSRRPYCQGSHAGRQRRGQVVRVCL